MNVNADPDGKLVSALVRGVSILRCFSSKCQELSAKELMDLTGLDDELAVLSGRTQTVELLDRIRGLHGDDPDRWRLPFQNARRNLL